MIRAATRAVGVSPTVTSRTKPRFSTPSGPSPPTNSSPSSAIPSKRRRAPSLTMMMAASFTYFHHALEEPHFFMCMMAASSFDIPAGFVAAAEEPGEDPRVQAIFNFYGYMAQYARSIGQEPNRQHMMQNCLAGWSTVHGFTVLCLSDHFGSLPEEKVETMAQAVIASAVRGLDFEAPLEVRLPRPKTR